MKWQTQLSNGCWPTVFIDNHDNPRMVSKIDPTGRYSDKISKMLAMLQLTLKGTPSSTKARKSAWLTESFQHRGF